MNILKMADEERPTQEPIVEEELRSPEELRGWVVNAFSGACKDASQALQYGRKADAERYRAKLMRELVEMSERDLLGYEFLNAYLDHLRAVKWNDWTRLIDSERFICPENTSRQGC